MSNIDNIIQIIKPKDENELRDMLQKLAAYDDTVHESLNKIIQEVKNPDKILIKKGLINILTQTHPKAFNRYYHHLKVRDFLKKDKKKPKSDLIKDLEVKCSCCAEIFFSNTDRKYFYICNKCLEKHNIKQATTTHNQHKSHK